MKTKTIIFFYGKECPICERTFPIVKKIEEESKGKIKFKLMEVWHNMKNLAYLRKFNDILRKEGKSLDFPIFLDVKGKRGLAGEKNEGKILEWIEKV